ncbi:unnamed protein product [Brugia pahangi]|uniref:Protein Smaug n=1 Tax=Brugia pahangi TaxID=6280 RepID=A0A0N4TTW4_BRUPA|nr:unnamed protein product [Brugia pahangi]
MVVPPTAYFTAGHEHSSVYIWTTGGRRRLKGKQGVNKACEPIALLLVLLLLLLLLLLHSPSEFVQSAAAPSDPRISARPLSMEQSYLYRILKLSHCIVTDCMWDEKLRESWSSILENLNFRKGVGNAVTFTVSHGRVALMSLTRGKQEKRGRGSPNISTNNNPSQDILTHELNAMQHNEQTQAEQMFLLALHERLAQQLRPQTELQRIWQNMMLGLPALLPPLDLTALPGTSQALMHPLYQEAPYTSSNK